MYSNNVLAQAFEYQKVLFENSYTFWNTLQTQGEKWVDDALEKNSLLPDGSKQVYSYWADFVKQNNENCRSYVESSLDRVRELFTAFETEPVKKKAATAKKAE